LANICVEIFSVEVASICHKIFKGGQ
jgi:hypothetical protein